MLLQSVLVEGAMIVTEFVNERSYVVTELFIKGS